MSKSHRDNTQARKKRGPAAFKKRADRRSGNRSFTGAWVITFRCGKEEAIPFASSSEIKQIAMAQHICDGDSCQPEKYLKLK